ncbi:SRPBCC domain-containing protein [Kordiimonas aestuarii]|uniref:SRPBCC domain-containing protein n=1 Tax=Kordiimonas aestuarii TaxID=1005925 RepID=UPI0021CF85DD|nr:SRPBCC domain-containing protein [Kordiimonas aestuarii]
MQQQNDLSLGMERYFGATPAQVFAAWVDPRAKAAWFAKDARVGIGGTGFREGGQETLICLENGRAFLLELTYNRIIEAEYIAYRCDTYVAGRLVSISTVTVTFGACGAGTHMCVYEDVVPVIGQKVVREGEPRTLSVARAAAGSC